MASRAATISGLTLFSTLRRITPASTSLKPLRKGGPPNTAETTAVIGEVILDEVQPAVLYVLRRSLALPSAVRSGLPSTLSIA